MTVITALPCYAAKLYECIIKNIAGCITISLMMHGFHGWNLYGGFCIEIDVVINGTYIYCIIPRARLSEVT